MYVVCGCGGGGGAVCFGIAVALWHGVERCVLWYIYGCRRYLFLWSFGYSMCIQCVHARRVGVSTLRDMSEAEERRGLVAVMSLGLHLYWRWR